MTHFIKIKFPNRFTNSKLCQVILTQRLELKFCNHHHSRDHHHTSIVMRSNMVRLSQIPLPWISPNTYHSQIHRTHHHSRDHRHTSIVMRHSSRMWCRRTCPCRDMMSPSHTQFHHCRPHNASDRHTWTPSGYSGCYYIWNHKLWSFSILSIHHTSALWKCTIFLSHSDPIPKIVFYFILISQFWWEPCKYLKE